MSFNWGNKFKITIFGESHGSMIGAVVEGLPAGFKPDLKEVQQHLDRRRAGGSGTTARQEPDHMEILSGLFKGHTTLAPLTLAFYNKDVKSEDYEDQQEVMRPGHADYPAHVKSNSFHDYRGGGSFGGRMTAPLVAAGSLARQFLEEKGVTIGSHVIQIGDLHDQRWHFPEPTEKQLELLSKKSFPVVNSQIAKEMEDLIAKTTEAHDSLGGIIEVAALGLPVGLGGGFFGGLEGHISNVFFAIPSVKAVEFGDGLTMASMRGSQTNDHLRYENNQVALSSNHAGGINGGLSNGGPIISRCTFRAAPSIGKEQRSINILTQKSSPLTLSGRHDACPTKRAAVILESALAIALADVML